MAAKLDKNTYKAEKREEIKAMLDNLAGKLSSSGEVAGYLNKRLFLLPDSVPCRKWSMLNQLMVILAGTMDARGYDQWRQVGRQVKKGAKATRILVPCFAKKDGDKEGEEEKSIAFFKAVPIFRAEDTEGDELDYAEELRALETTSHAELPLRAIAENLGLKIEYGFSSGYYYGYFSPEAGKIMLCTDAEQTFFHELAHAVDHALGNLTPSARQDPLNEVVAEFTACFLASQYGKAPNMLYTREYVKGYAGREHVSIALSRAMTRTIAIIEYIQAAKA